MSQLKVTVSRPSNGRVEPWTGLLHEFVVIPGDGQTIAIIEDNDGNIHEIGSCQVKILREPQPPTLIGKKVEVWKYAIHYEGKNELLGVGTILVYDDEGVAHVLMEDSTIRSGYLTTLKIL